MIVVFHDISQQASSANRRETQAITDAARLFGCRVYDIPSDFAECETAENALTYVPQFQERILGIWVGFIPTYERYAELYQAALQKNIQLVNSPELYRLAMEFDQFYPLLNDLTPKSLILESIDQIPMIKDQLGYPVFVKGAVKLDKEQGWSAVVANNKEELDTIVKRILDQPVRSRGKAIVRQLVKLRYLSEAPNGFPMGREYRLFLYKGQMLAYGFYWDIEPLPLSSVEEIQVIQLARQVAGRIKTPFLAVDIRQLETGDWIVIEVGDAQFSGLSHIAVLELWSKIKDLSL